MIEARFVPIAEWPGKKTGSHLRKNDPFRGAAYTKTLDLLEKELSALGAKEILIQAYFERKDIRNDGWPRSSARPKEPGVIVTFKKRDGKTMSMPCDRFLDWEGNLRAVALSLESLRRVDRYGVTQSGEQYRGWEQLPPAAQEPEMSPRDAAYYLESLSGVIVIEILEKYGMCKAAIHAARLKTHPDKGGLQSAFLRVQQAAAVLRKHHGVE